MRNRSVASSDSVGNGVVATRVGSDGHMRSSSPPCCATCSANMPTGACSTHAARTLRNGCIDTPVSSQRPYDDGCAPGRRNVPSEGCEQGRLADPGLPADHDASQLRCPDERELARERLELLDPSDEPNFVRQQARERDVDRLVAVIGPGPGWHRGGCRLDAVPTRRDPPLDADNVGRRIGAELVDQQRSVLLECSQRIRLPSGTRKRPDQQSTRGRSRYG